MKHLLLFNLLIFIHWGTPVAGQATSENDELFDETELLQITLKTDIRNLQADRGDSASYHKAKLIYPNGDEKATLSVKIKARGNFRRNPEVCEFPPLWMKISEKNRDGTPFYHHKKLKIVTTCQGEELVLKEYLIYKHFALLSPYSFKVRLAKITIEDTDDVIEDREIFAFFIEDDKRMAERYDGNLWKGDFLMKEEADKTQLGLIHLFQYQIGNTDWDLYSGKNIKRIQVAGTDKKIPVPYDFDWSKVCDAPYTELEESFERRQFRPLCLTKDEFDVIHAQFVKNKEKIYLLYKDFAYLKKKDFKTIKIYFDAFYRMLDDQEAVKNTFLNHCESAVGGSG